MEFASISSGMNRCTPAVDRDVVNGDAAFDQQILDVAAQEPVAHTPAHRHGDHLWREAEPSETGPRSRHMGRVMARRHSLPRPLSTDATDLS